MNSDEQITLSPEETISEITSILARGYLRYRKSQDSDDKTGVCQATYTKTNKNNMLTRNNLTIRPTRAFVHTSVNKGRDGKRTKRPKRAKNDQRTVQ